MKPDKDTPLPERIELPGGWSFEPLNGHPTLMLLTDPSGRAEEGTSWHRKDAEVFAAAMRPQSVPQGLPFRFDVTKAGCAADPEGQQTVYLDGKPALYINLMHPRWNEIQSAMTAAPQGVRPARSAEVEAALEHANLYQNGAHTPSDDAEALKTLANYITALEASQGGGGQARHTDQLWKDAGISDNVRDECRAELEAEIAAGPQGVRPVRSAEDEDAITWLMTTFVDVPKPIMSARNLAAYIAQLEAAAELTASKVRELANRRGKSFITSPQPVQATQAGGRPIVLKGIGKITGDGWKDTTTVGEVVFVWNTELPTPYSPGQYPRIGYTTWSASTEQYDFSPATIEEANEWVEQRVIEARASAQALREALERCMLAEAEKRREVAAEMVQQTKDDIAKLAALAKPEDGAGQTNEAAARKAEKAPV